MVSVAGTANRSADVDADVTGLVGVELDVANVVDVVIDVDRGLEIKLVIVIAEQQDE